MVSLYSNKIIEPMLIQHPWALAFMSGIVSYLIYRAINSRDNVRRFCTMPWLGLFSASNKEHLKRFYQERMLMMQDQKIDRATEITGAFFSERIRSQHKSLHLAHLWGQVYLIIGPFVARWKSSLLISLFLPIFFCFFSPPEGNDGAIFEWIIFILASLPGSLLCSYPRFNIFLLTGRKEHLWRGIIVLITALLITLGFMGTSILLLNVLSAIFPNFILLGRSFVFPSIRWIFLFAPIIILPLFGGLFILHKKNLMLMISLIIMIPAAIIISCYAIIALENQPFINGLMVVLLLATLTWGFHLAALYYDSMKRSLC